MRERGRERERERVVIEAQKRAAKERFGVGIVRTDIVYRVVF